MSYYQNHMVDGADAAIDRADAVAAHNAALVNNERAKLAAEVREAFMTGDSAAIVPGLSIGKKSIGVLLTEVAADHMWDQDANLLRLIACAAHGDIVGAAAAAESIIATVSQRHAEDVCERMEIAGEVML